VREPGLAGKIVVLDTQLKAINLLQSFADIHPMVVFLKITNPDSIRQLSLDALDDDALLTIVRVSEQTEQEWGHVFTHVVEIGDSFEETVSQLAEVVRDNVQASYWANCFDRLPSTTPSVAVILRSVVMQRTSQRTFGFDVVDGRGGGVLHTVRLNPNQGLDMSVNHG
jgi:hypothetical protein